MSADRNNCLGCLLPPCLIHDNHPSTSKASKETNLYDDYCRSLRSSKRIKELKAGEASTSGISQNKRKSLKGFSSKRNTKSKPIRRSHRAISKAKKSTKISQSSIRNEIIRSQNLMVADQEYVDLREEQPHCSHQWRQVSQRSKDPANDHQVKTSSVHQESTNAVEENESSSSSVSQGQGQIETGPPKKLPESSAENEKKNREPSVCVVRPFAHLSMLSNSPDSVEGGQQNSLNFSEEMQRETIQVGRNPSPPPIDESSERLISQDMDLEPVREDNAVINQNISQASLRAMSQVARNVFPPPVVEHSGREISQNIENIQLFRETYLSETSDNAVMASQNFQTSAPPNNTVPQSARNYLSSVAQERRETLHQVQSGQMNSNTNILSTQLITVEEAARLDAVHRNTHARLDAIDNSFTALSERILSQINSLPVHQQALVAAHAQAFIHGQRCPIHSNRTYQNFPQSNSLPYTGEQFSGTSRATVHARTHVNQQIISVENRMPNQSISNVSVGVIGFPGQMMPRQLMQENPHSIPQVANMPNWNGNTMRPITINQPTSLVDNQRTYERFMQNENNMQHHQSVAERYGPYQLSSMVSGGPYPNDAQRSLNIESAAGRFGPTVANGPYPNLSQRSSGPVISNGSYQNNNQPASGRYMPIITNGPYQNFSQQPFNNELAIGRYAPTVSYAPFNNHFQRTGLLADRNGPMVSGGPDQNNSDDQSSSTESIPDNVSQNPQHYHPFPQTSSINLNNSTQIFPDRRWQLSPQMNLGTMADPRITREPMQNFPPSIVNSQHQYPRSENLSSPARYFLQQPPPTLQMTSNSSASQQNNWINQQPVPYRGLQHPPPPGDIYRF